MTKFLVELPHEPTVAACAKAIDVLLNAGSHFFSQADWGCKDGVHNAWVVVEVDNKDEARRIVPIQFRERAKVVQLNSFTMEDAHDMLARHKA